MRSGGEPAVPGHSGQVRLGQRRAARVLVVGAYVGLATFGLFNFYVSADSTAKAAQTIAFAAVVIIKKVNVFDFRSLRRPAAPAAPRTGHVNA
jgi:hypothetical protein